MSEPPQFPWWNWLAVSALWGVVILCSGYLLLWATGMASLAQGFVLGFLCTTIGWQANNLHRAWRRYRALQQRAARAGGRP